MRESIEISVHGVKLVGSATQVVRKIRDYFREYGNRGERCYLGWDIVDRYCREIRDIIYAEQRFLNSTERHQREFVGIG